MKYSRLRRWGEDYVKSDATPHPKKGSLTSVPKAGKILPCLPGEVQPENLKRILNKNLQKILPENLQEILPQNLQRILLQNLP